MTDEHINYVREQLAAGHGRPEIEEALREAGHDEETITKLFEAVAQQTDSSEGGEGEAFSAAPEAGVPGVPVTAAEQTTAAATDSGRLIGYWALIGRGFSLMMSRPGLMGAAFIGFSLTTILVQLIATGPTLAVSMFMGTNNFVINIGLFVLTVLGSAIGVFPAFALFRALVFRDQEVGFWESYGFVLRHILPVFVVVLLLQIVLFGGFVLLIVPAIVLMFYLFFSFVAMVAEDRTGLSALLRSYHLVRGHWWGVVLRTSLLTLVVYFLGIVLIVLLSIVLSVTLSLEVAAGVLILILVGSIIVTFAGFWLTSSMVLLFESLRSLKPADTFAAGNHSKMRIFLIVCAVIGALVYIAAGVSSAYTQTVQPGYQYPDIRQPSDFAPPAEPESMEDKIITNFGELHFQADMYAALENDFSYSGFCTMAKSEGMFINDSSVCNDSTESAAFSAELTPNNYYCRDTEGFAGNTQIPLGEAATCQ